MTDKTCDAQRANYVTTAKVVLTAVFGAVAIAAMHYDYPVAVVVMCGFMFFTWA